MRALASHARTRYDCTCVIGVGAVEIDQRVRPNFGALPKLTTSGCTCCKAWWGETTVLAAAHIIGPLVLDVLCVFWDFSSVCGRKYFPLDIAKAALGCALEEKAVSTIANGRSIAMCTRQRATRGLVEGGDVEGASILER